MCGICGIINLNGERHTELQETKVKGMIERMKHRGPDDDGYFTKDQLTFGFVRLSIIDLSEAGHQPFISSCQRFTMVFNGEIYNYIELREELIELGHEFRSDTDTEVLLNSFKEWGDDCFNRFNGMWAVAILDNLSKEVTFSRDRYGIKPFYYSIENDNLYFASEIKPILHCLEEKVAPNDTLIYDYLVHNRTDHTGDTFFRNIKKLQKGEIAKINLGEKSLPVFSKWYDLEENVKRAQPFKTKEEFRESMERSLKLRMRSDVPVGVCLSGGIDSSAITALLAKNLNIPHLNTFSAVYLNNRIDESEFIDEFNWENITLNKVSPNSADFMNDLSDFVRGMEEPIPALGPYAQYKVMELATKKVKVTLDGQGADEYLGGYHYFFGFYFKELLLKFKLGKLVKEVLSYFKVHRSFYGIKTMIFLLLPNRTRSLLRFKKAKYISSSFYKKENKNSIVSDSFYSAKTLQEANLKHFQHKLEHLLKWEDHNSMRFSVESRVPFLDPELVEKGLATDPTLIIRNGTTKYILKESMKGIIPDKIYNRQDKSGFAAPQEDWFREKEWRLKVNEIINSDKFKNRKYFNLKYINQVFQDHLDGKVNASKEIWKWINLELWLREFIDD
tara:strand:+ start:15959 stop:17809 length:1851 start_codon:yes stop_codon:yes gene_type:complete